MTADRPAAPVEPSTDTADPSPFITREMDLKVFRSAVQSADDARHVYLSVPVARSVAAAVAARDAELAKLREVIGSVLSGLVEVLPDDPSRPIGDTLLSTLDWAVDALEGTAL